MQCLSNLGSIFPIFFPLPVAGLDDILIKPLQRQRLHLVCKSLLGVDLQEMATAMAQAAKLEKKLERK